MKLLFCATLVTLCVAVFGYNSTWGSVGAFDQVIYHDYVIKSASFMKVVTKDVSFPVNVS